MNPTTIQIFAFVLVLCTWHTEAFVSPSHLATRPSSNVNNEKNDRTRLAFFNFGKPVQEEEPPTPPPPEEPEEEPDLVEKLFTVFFGKPEQKPMGLDRFNSNRFPEQYPATKTEWAEPVEGDDEKVAKLRPLLKNTNLEFRNLALTYDANKHGWNPEKFHARVDKKGPAVVVCTTESNLICGGYNPKGWVGYGEARGSIAAFLFVQDSTSESGWTKLIKVGGPSLAQVDAPEAGPSFGADSLVVPLAKANPKAARSKLGSYYERFPDGNNSLFRTAASVKLRNLQVYHGVWGPDEYIPFTDAEPFALY